MDLFVRIVVASLLLGMAATKSPFVNDFFREPDGRPMALKAFSWNNCGLSTDIFRVSSFSLSPDPIVLPGTATVSFEMAYTADFGSPLRANVTIARKVGPVYLKLPCVGEIGSCDYDDFCQILSYIPQCPTPLTKRGIECECPFKKGSYSLPPTSAQLEYIPLVAGDYRAKIDLTTTSGHVGCYEIYVSLSEEYSIFGQKQSYV